MLVQRMADDRVLRFQEALLDHLLRLRDVLQEFTHDDHIPVAAGEILRRTEQPFASRETLPRFLDLLTSTVYPSHRVTLRERAADISCPASQLQYSRRPFFVGSN